MPFSNGTNISGGSELDQGRKEIRRALRSLNKKSRSSPEVKLKIERFVACSDRAT